MRLIHGDSLVELDTLDECSIDSCVTDPPYELGFMGRKWDKSGIAFSIEFWEKVYRTLKPGGYLLAFSATRNYHRMACAIEDAGFVMRDCISWIYGSGFPKGLDIGKGIDAKLNTGGSSPKNLRQDRMGDDYAPTGQVDYRKGRMFDPEFDKNGRKIIGRHPHPIGGSKDRIIYNIGSMVGTYVYITEPATEEAKKWEGWRTALKPAQELIVVAQKPLDGTYVENVLKWGVGALNIDGCRIGDEVIHMSGYGTMTSPLGAETKGGFGFRPRDPSTHVGRFPANVIFDEEAAKLLDEQSGVSKSGESRADRGTGGMWHAGNGIPCGPQYGDSGGASRFFYTTKASQDDRNQGLDGKSSHPTVKPVDLMQYLVRLVTPKGGVCLDPFLGSGSTGKACLLEGMDFVGIEREAEYYEIAKKRIDYVNPAEFKLGQG